MPSTVGPVCDGDKSSSSVTTCCYFFCSWSGVAEPFYIAVSDGPIVPGTYIRVWSTSGITDKRNAKCLEKTLFQCHFFQNKSHMDYTLGSNPVICGKKQYRFT